MKGFGEYLRRERELRGISIDEVAQSTKIGAPTLEAIEAGDLEALPPIPFVKGFLRAYADYVGLDPNAVVLRFEAAFLADDPSGRLGFHVPWRDLARVAGIAGASGLLVLGVAWAVVNRDHLHGRRTGTPPTVKPPAETENAKDPSEEELIEKIKNDLGLKEVAKSIAEAPVEVPPDPRAADARVPRSLAPDFRVPREEPGVAGAGEPSQPAIQPRPNGRPERPPSGARDAVTGRPDVRSAAAQHRVTVRAEAPSWVQIQADESPPVERQLQAGDTLVSGGRRFVLRIGNGGAVRIEMDGQDLGNAGKLGEFVRLELPLPVSKRSTP